MSAPTTWCGAPRSPFGVAEQPVRVDAAAAALTGKPIDSTAIQTAAATAWLIEPIPISMPAASTAGISRKS